MNDNITRVYEELKSGGADVGSADEFKKWLSAKGEQGYRNRLSVYNELKGGGADVGSYDDFRDWMGFRAAQPVSEPTGVGEPMTEQDKIRMSLQMGQMKQQVQQGIANTNAKIGRMMEPLTQKGRERRRLGEFQARMAGTPTHVIGFNTASPAPAGSGARGGSQQKPVQSEQSPQPYGVKYENGKAKTQWVLPDGTLTTSLIEANQAEYEARTARLAHQFQDRMKENGLDPNKPEDVRKQAQLDYEAPMRKAIDDEWQRAEAEDRAADEAYRKDMERAEGGGFWDRLKKSITPLGPDGMPLRRGDETLRDIKRAAKRQDTFNLEKMAQSVLQNMPQEYKDNQMLNYSRYFREHPSELKGRTVSQAAKEALQGEVYHATYERAVQARMPKSKTEFLLRKVADQPFFSQTMADNMAARLFSHSIGTEAADMDAMGRYGTDHRALDITGTVLNMAIDPTTYISGGVGSFAGKQALKLSGKVALKGASKEAAERYVGRTLAGRMVAGVAAGSANFGTFEGLKNMQQQMRLGGTLNPETGEYEFSAGDMLKATGHGMLLGSVTGTLSPVLGNVSDKLVKATESTAGKVGIRAGELMTSTVAEGTIFATPEWIENAQLADDDPRKRKAMDIWTGNMAMMIGFKVSHGIKSAPQVIAGLRPIAEPKTMEERNHNRRSFAERLRKRMDASPRDLDFTKEERDELKRNGYGDLASLFTRTPKQPTKPKAKPTMTDGKTMTFDVDFQHAEAKRVSNPEFDGYEAMERLMQDPNVSQSARAKAYYILTGRMLPMGTITGYTTNKDANGVTVQAMTAQGEVITSRHFKNEEEAKKEEANIMRQAELNSVDVGERYKEAAANAKVVQAAVESVAPGADFATVMRNYKAVKEGDKDAIAAYGKMVEDIDHAIEANKSMADGERPEAIRASIKEETGVNVDATLRKEPKNRTEEEQAAVEDYIKRLFPEQKSEEAGAGAEAEQPMSEAESAAAAAYDQARLLWDKVEKGDADAKAEVDAITLRMQEAYQMCEDAFGADAEMRIAEINEDPWPLVNNPELSEDQQDAVLYYVNAKAAMEGVMDASNEAADGKRKEVEANVERHTHKDMGVVQPATMKVDDKPVYVVKGNVVMLPDGSGIDVRNSDQSIVICDAETGEYKFASPDQLFSLGEAIDPQTELDEAYANIQAEHEAVLGVPETPDGVEYGVNDTFTLLDGDGVAVNGEVQNISDDGVEIRTDEPLNGKRVQVIPAEVFESMVESINDADGNPVWKRKVGETYDLTDDHGQQRTALSRVPISEETGEPMFEKADRETALDALNEVTGGNDENTTAIVRAQVEQATNALEALKKKEPTKKAPSLKGSPMAMVKAQQEAEANYNTAMEEYNAQVAAAEEKLKAWSRINSLMNDRKRAIREQQEAERKAREEKLHAEAVARLEEDKRIAAEKAAEQEAVGTHAVNPKIKAKWDGSTKVEGNPNAITLADGSTIRGHYVLTEAGAATASHDVNNAYEPTEGFPVDENGESVNDRDYKRDKDAQRIVRDMADSYDSRALQTPVIVSKDGVVLSGNNRTMSGEIAAKNGTDKAYVDHLREFGDMFGFTPEQIDGMQHPRVVFVPDEELPYDASTFARFNAEQQKKQSKPEHAVKLGKIVPGNVFTSITNDISRFDRMSDYYADDKAVASAISQLLDAGVINEMQLPELRTGSALSAAGKELIENTLIGKVFQTSPDAVRQIISTPTLRQSVVMGLNEIANNRTLAKSGYDLSKELAAAVDLVSRAKSESPDIYKEGVPVSPYGRQQGLFDDEYGDSRVTDGLTLMLADILNSGKPSELRKFISVYNNEAASPAGGQLDMFSGKVESKEELLNRITEYFRNATPREQQAIVDAAIAERKQRAETTAQDADGTKRDGGNPSEATAENGSIGLRNDGRGRVEGHSDQRQGDLAKTENVAAKLSSNKTDEYGKPLVLAKDGTTTFGMMDPKSGLKEAPIQLSLGENHVGEDGKNHGYGLLHIEAGHGKQIRDAGFSSVEEFVEEVAKNYVDIREGAKIGNTQTYLLEVTDEHNNTLFVQLSKDGTYWNVNSAGIFNVKYSRRKSKVHSVPALGEGTNTNTSEVNSGHSEGVTAPAGNSSKTSFGKVINNQSDLQENGEKPSEKEGVTPLSEQIATASAEVNTEPTEAQKEAGNYKKGHVQVDTFDITIEQPQGSVRKGTDADGKQWESKMNNTYGYIRGAVGVDGDHIDVFISNDIDGWDGRKVFVVDQYNPDGSFDEHKVMLGFNDADEAKGDYLANYEKGWENGRRIDITGVNLEDFEKWIGSSKRKTKPFGEYSSVKKETVGNSFEQKTDNQGNPLNADGTLKLEKVKSVDDLTDEDFSKPTRSVELPQVPENVDNALGADGKPVIIKKNIFEKNWEAHKFPFAESRSILKSALYNTDLVGQTQPTKRPLHWVAIKLDEKSPIVVLEVNENKDNVEIVGWYTLDGRNLERIKRQAEKNGGELVMLSPKDKVESLSTPQHDLSSDGKDTEKVSSDKENGEKTFGGDKPSYASLGLSTLVGEIEFVSDDEVVAITNAMKANATVAPTVEINDANWKESVETPVGSVKMGENQKAKLFAKGREQQYGMLLETLSNPDVVLEEKDKEQNMFHERPFSYLFVKTFQKEDGSKFVHFESVTVSQEGMEVSISSHIIRENQLKNKLKSDRLLYKATALDAPANTSAEQPIVGGSLSSDGKDTEKDSSDQENGGESVENARLQKDEGYSEFADKHGVSADDVRRYAEGMALGNLALANQALASMRVAKRIEHRGTKLSEFVNLFAPLKNELYERFGNIDELHQEYVRRAEEERGMMEAARRKAEEEEAKRKQHLEELSMLTEDEIDKRYAEAIENGDEAAAREMLDEAARRKGYGDGQSDYQGVGAWAAPSDPGYESDAARRADMANNTVFNVEDIALGYSSQPSDYFEHPKFYAQDTPHGRESCAAIVGAMAAVKRGDKDVKVRVYRAVPTSVKEGKLRNGDWVTPSRKYAEMHGNNRLEGKYRIIEDEVPVSELWWDGNDANEWGYDNGKVYKYKNVKNNRKSDALVTRDDKGAVILPSKRFNQRKADERYQRGVDGVKPSKAEVALRDAVIDRLRENGMEVITDVAEGQRVLDEANGIHSYEVQKIEVLDNELPSTSNGVGKPINEISAYPLAKLLKGVEKSYDKGKKLLEESKKRSADLREQRVGGADGLHFFRTANGEVYGFTVGGKIYVDPRIATSETPVHEYAHLWASALRSGNKEEWQNVVELMKGTKVWDEVKKRYPELKTDDEIADEVIATYSGRRGAERLREEQRKIAEGDGSVLEKAEAISALERVKRALKKFWKGVADFLHIHYKSAEEVADRVMRDLLDGVDPRMMGKGEDGVRFNAKQKRALETASLGNAPRSLTVVSSATGAKILNSIDKLVESLEKSATQPKTFIGNVAKALGASRLGSGSEYATFETMNGDIVTIRLANHNAHVSGFDHNGRDNGISIVVSPKPNEGLINDGDAHIVEFYYDSIKLRRADGKPLADIVRSIKQALYSGEFKDTTGLAERQEVNGADVIRYQFIGEKGATAADHAEEVSVRLDNLSVAREMEASDRDAKAIKLATGWERGADGKWRYEIADMKEFDRNGNLLYRKNHPDYARYVELLDKEVANLFEDGEALTDEERAEFEQLSKKYESDKFGGEKLDNNHRLEAYVDAPELFKAYPELRGVGLRFEDTGGNEMASYRTISRLLDIEGDDVGEIVVNTGKVSVHTPTRELKSVILHEMQHVIQEIEGFAMGGNPGQMNSYREYQKLGGEVEARNVQKRMGMSAEERRASLAAETEDVAREDQVFLYGGDVAMIGSRVEKRMAQIGEHFKDYDLTSEQRSIVDVFCGSNDNLKVPIERDGKSFVLMMRQGSENGAGTKHSLYRHFGTGVGYITADDILNIPTVMANGAVNNKLRGKSRLVEYTYKDKTGCIYTLLTEKKKGAEVFNDFYTNRKASSLSTFNTSEDAHTGSDNAFTAAKLENVSETAKVSGENVGNGAASDGDGMKFRLLDEDDPKAMELESLPESELVPVYRNVQAFEDDALGSPMAFTDAETGERRTLEGRRWNYSAPPKVELTEEQQRKLDELNNNGYIMVNGKKSTELQINDGLKFVKPKTKEAQLQYFLKKNPEDKGLWAAYDPYDHAIETPLNTQFGEAYKRPNLVVVRSLIPKSEIDEPFHADYALLPTGAHQWNNGRTLYLSRWSKIDKVLTREEEAKLIDEYWKKHPGKREELKTHRDYNRFVPQVRRELEKMGYRFELDGKELTPEESLALDKQNWESRDVIPGREGHTPFISNEDIARINAKMAGKWVGEPKEAMESAMSERVTELSERLHTPVRIIRTEEEVAALPSVRQRRMKGSFNSMTGEVTIVVPNNANMADIENTFVHEVVGHDGLRVLFPDEAKLNNALDELYRVSKDEIRGTIDRMAQKMYDAEVDRIREKKRKEHVANGEDANASYYADMAEAHAEASKKREQFKCDATEEYGADLAGRIGEKGFEKMSAEELTFWGKLKAMLQKALQKLLDGLKIPGKRKWSDKDWAFVLHEAYKRKKNGGKPTVFDAADTEVMRRKTGFGEMKFSDGKHEQKPQVATTIADMKQRVTELFEKAKTVEFVGKPASIGRLSVDGKAYLEKLSGLKFKEFVDFVLNPSDLNHIRSDHYGENEKDKGNNVPLTDEDIQNMVDVLNQPDGILYGVDKKDGRKLFFFLKEAGNGLYNLTEVCSTKKGNLTAKSFFKSKKKGISQRVMEIKDSLLPTSVTYSGEFLSSDAKIPTLFEINEGSSKNVADEGIMFRDGRGVVGHVPDAVVNRLYEDQVKDTRNRTMLGAMAGWLSKDGRKRWKNKFAESYFDYTRSVKALQDAISEGSGSAVAWFEDVWKSLNAKSSIDEREVDTMTRMLAAPLGNLISDMVKMSDGRYSLDDIEAYLNAKHGVEERNPYMLNRAVEKGLDALRQDERHKALAEGYSSDEADAIAELAAENARGNVASASRRDYSGLTGLFDPKHEGRSIDELEDMARDYVSEIEDYFGSDVTDELWKRVNALNAYSLRKSYECGLLSRKQYDEVRSMYKYYVPLRGWHDGYAGDVYNYVTRGGDGSMIENALKKAYGRTSRAGNILGTMTAMANSAIVMGNKNMVAQTFMNLALNHEDTGMFTVSEAWYEKAADGSYRLVTPVLTEDMSAEEVADAVATWEDEMQAKAAAGEGVVRSGKFTKDFQYNLEAWKERQHCVRVLRNGKEYMVYINGNPRATQAINGLLNPDYSSGVADDFIRKYMRYKAQVQTSLSPKFMISNLQRDAATAVGGSYAKFGVGYAGDVVKNLAGNVDDIFRLFHKDRTGTLDMNVEKDRWFKEFVEHGGMTGVSSIRKKDEYEAQYAKSVKRAVNPNRSAPARGWESLMDNIEFVNRCVENLTRFSVYMASRKSGKSVKDSVFDAKECSVNFNMKGSGAWGNATLRKYIMYANPALQSLRMISTWYDANKPRTIALFSSGVVLGFLNAMILSALCGGGDDEDDNAYYALSDYNRHNYFNVGIGNRKFLHWRLPQEMVPLYAIGQITYDRMSGRINNGQALHQTLVQLNNLSPMAFVESELNYDQGAGNTYAKTFLKAVTPDVVSDFADAYLWQEDFLGRRIGNRSEWNTYAPEWRRVDKRTPDFFVKGFEWLDKATGGTDHKRGGVSQVLNPSAVWYILEQQGGGLSQLGHELYNAGLALMGGDGSEDLEAKDYPFVSKFYVDGGTDAARMRVKNEKFWMYRMEYEAKDAEIKAICRDLKLSALEKADLIDCIADNRYLLMAGATKGWRKLRKLKSVAETAGDKARVAECDDNLRMLVDRTVRLIEKPDMVGNGVWNMDDLTDEVTLDDVKDRIP